MKIRRGEIWRVDLTAGSQAKEINKTHPCAVVNSDEVAACYVAVLNNDAIGILPLRIVVPLSGWQDRYSIAPWNIPITPTTGNGLSKKPPQIPFRSGQFLKQDL